jgi:hypothetical protein
MVNEEMHGHVAAVARETDGDELAVTAAAGVTVLTVRDVADFDEAGGTVRLDDDTSTSLPNGGGTLRDYVAITDDPPTITLAMPTPAALEAGARVDVWDTDQGGPTVVYRATVIDDVTGEPLEAEVSHDLIDKLQSEVRDGTAESVVCRSDESGRWSVVDVLGRVPVSDGEFIDPETLPEPEPTPPPVAPAAPTLAVPTTTAYAVALSPFARVSLSWSAVTLDVDGATISDALVYEVEQRAPSETTWQARTSVATTSVTLSQFAPNEAWSFRVRAVRTNATTGLSTAGAWSNERTITTAVGSPPASTPAPVVRGGIGAIVVATPAVAGDFAVTVDVWVSTTNPVPTSGTPTFSVSGDGPGLNFVRAVGGTAVVPGTTYYVRARARNVFGNGPLSTQVSSTPEKINSPDIAADAITANMLTANNAFIEAMQVSDFTGVTVTGATLRTAATGERVVVRNDGGGGIIESFSGLSGETPTTFDPTAYSGVLPALRIANGTAGTYSQASSIRMNSGTPGVPFDSQHTAEVSAESNSIRLAATDRVALSGKTVVVTATDGGTTIVGGLAATMGNGSVGTGTFASSVDSRVDARVAAGAGAPGYANLALVAGVTGSVQYRQFGPLVHVEGAVTFASLANNTTRTLCAAGAIPAAARPIQSLNLAQARLNGGTTEAGIVLRGADGSISVTNKSGAAVTTAQFAYSYLVA